MAILYLVNRAALLDDCLKVANGDDAVLLIEDGVYAVDNATTSPTASSATSSPAMYALREDVLARGLTGRATEVELIGYDDFVRLTCDHQPIVSWSG